MITILLGAVVMLILLLIIPFIVFGTIWFWEEVYTRYLDWLIDLVGF